MSEQDTAYESFTAWLATRGGEEIFLDETWAAGYAAGVVHGRAEARALMDLEQHDVIEATFTPRRTDDLKTEGVCPIGTRITWSVGWLIEESETYAGEWACLPYHAPLIYQWAPSGDLSDIRLVDRVTD